MANMYRPPEQTKMDLAVVPTTVMGPALLPTTPAMNVSQQILFRLHHLLEPPERWTKRKEAKDIDGKPIGPLDECAACWCLTGGLAKIMASHPELVGGLNVIKLRQRPQRALQWAAGMKSLQNYNDTHHHDEVLNTIRRAIEIAGDGLPSWQEYNNRNYIKE